MATVEAVKTTGNKSNKAFMILSALGILFVVDEHLGRPISFLSQIFPYDSFYMPLFMFISGYFFSAKYAESFSATGQFIWKRFKKGLLPFAGWVVFYGIFTATLRAVNIIHFGDLSIKECIKLCLTTGATYGFNSPAWFVPTLFAVSVVYCLLRCVFRKLWNSPAAMLIFVLLGALAVYAANTGFNTNSHIMILKVAFFLQFYHFGSFFKQYLEPAFDKINGGVVCAGCIAVNLAMQSIFDNNIRFPNCAYMGGFFTDLHILPLITSVSGILFWLKVSKLLAHVLGENKLVNFISDNTFFIMTHHLTARALFNGLLILGKAAGITALAKVDAAAFKKSAWYIFNGPVWVKVTCFIFTVAATLLACWGYIKLKNAIKRLYEKIKTKKATAE